MNDLTRLLTDLVDPIACVYPTPETRKVCTAHGWIEESRPCPQVRAKLLLSEVHVMELIPTGWKLHHPALCRATLPACAVNDALGILLATSDKPPVDWGTYRVTLSDGGLLSFVPFLAGGE